MRKHENQHTYKKPAARFGTIRLIWVGPELENSPYWREGSYPIWNQFEVIMDQGTVIGERHQWYALATPNGLHALSTFKD